MVNIKSDWVSKVAAHRAPRMAMSGGGHADNEGNWIPDKSSGGDNADLGNSIESYINERWEKAENQEKSRQVDRSIDKVRNQQNEGDHRSGDIHRPVIQDTEDYRKGL